MTRELAPLEPLAVAVLTVIVSLSVLVDLDSPARSVLVAAFLLVCPGLALVRLLRLGEPLLELTLGIACSLALAGLVSVTMLYAHVWSPGAGLAILAAITLGASWLEVSTRASRWADLSPVNLAAPDTDGSKMVVPRRVSAATTAEGEGEGAAATPAGGPLHLDAATLDELDELPGVGPATAQKIVDWREQHGSFSSVDDLYAIPGIGPARLEQLRKLAAP